MNNYNQQHLFGSDYLVKDLVSQADAFMRAVNNQGGFPNARFATVTVYKYHCEASFYWGDKGESKLAKVVFGSSNRISLSSIVIYPDKDIESLKEVISELGYEFEFKC